MTSNISNILLDDIKKNEEFLPTIKIFEEKNLIECIIEVSELCAEYFSNDQYELMMKTIEYICILTKFRKDG